MKDISILFSKNTILKNIDKMNYLGDIYNIPYNNYLEGYEKFYNFLLEKKYFNEYIFKNTIALNNNFNNLYFEFISWGNICDVVIVNDKITAYEIKTNYDNFNRLQKQLDSYKNIFEYINVVIPEEKINKLLNLKICDKIGIILLDNDLNYIEYKKPESNIETLSKKYIYSNLRKNEYIDITLKYFKGLPECKPVFLKRECFKLFEDLNINIINKEFLNYLNKRKFKFNGVIPLSLYSLINSLDLNKNGFLKLLNKLNNKGTI